MSDVKNIAQDVLQALPNKDEAQIFHALGSSIIITDHKIFEIYESGESVFVQVAERMPFEPVGDDTMWWATVPGEANPHFTDEGLEPYRVGEVRYEDVAIWYPTEGFGETLNVEIEHGETVTEAIIARGRAQFEWVLA